MEGLSCQSCKLAMWDSIWTPQIIAEIQMVHVWPAFENADGAEDLEP